MTTETEKPTTTNSERTTVLLDVPIVRGKHTISELQVRRPRSGELRGLNLQDVLSLDINAMHKLLPRITVPSLTEAEVSELDPADLVELGTETASFFIKKAKLATLEA